MGVVLAVFVLSMILIGFTMLTLLPLLFVWLAVAVYTEPWSAPVFAGHAPAGDAGFGSPAEIDAPPAEPVLTRPKVMAAGRRHPL